MIKSRCSSFHEYLRLPALRFRTCPSQAHIQPHIAVAFLIACQKNFARQLPIDFRSSNLRNKLQLYNPGRKPPLRAPSTTPSHAPLCPNSKFSSTTLNILRNSPRSKQRPTTSQHPARLSQRNRYVPSPAPPLSPRHFPLNHTLLISAVASW